MFSHFHSAEKANATAASPARRDVVPALADIRRHCRSRFGGFGTLPSGCSFEPGKLGAVPGEWIRLDGLGHGRLILYFHGGSFVAGSPKSHRPLIARLAKVSGAHAFVPDYRLAPEFPFPAAVRDGLEVYREMLGSHGRPGAIVLAGDGAGGGLALSVVLAIRNAGLPMPAALVAMSPWADLSLSGWSVLKNRDLDTRLSWADLFVCARHYLGPAVPSDLYASPLFASFQGFPPMMIHAGAHELLRDDASRIGSRADAAGVNASVEVYDGQGHLFQADPHNRAAPAALQRMGHFIRAQMALDGKPAAAPL